MLMLSVAALGATKVLVTVVDPKTGIPVTDLKSSDFIVTDGGSPRAVEAVEYAGSPVDVMLLVDSSLMGHAVQSAAADLIQQLREKEQMALVSYHSSADLIQDFTSSKQSLLRALSGIKYGNEPRALDAIYAAADGGFGHAVYRKVLLVLTAGFEGYSRMNERNVIKLARKSGIQIFVLYLSGHERSLFDTLARNTGGASLKMQDLAKTTKTPAPRVFELLRSFYTMVLSGNLAPTERFKIETNRPQKLFVSALVLD